MVDYGQMVCTVMASGRASGSSGMTTANYVRSVYYNGKEEGEWHMWYDYSQLEEKGAYCNGKKEGVWQHWYGDGQLWEKGVYHNDKKESQWIEYGNIVIYHDGDQVNNERVYIPCLFL